MKILVISLAGIGDTLIATPLLHELRLIYPQATIDALVLWPAARDVLTGNPWINTIRQQNFFETGSLAAMRYLLGLRPHRYDLSINVHPQSKIHYRVAAWLAGARLRLSHRYDNASPLDRLFIHRSLPQDYAIHSIDNNLRLLELIHESPRLPNPAFEIFLSADETAAAAQLLDRSGPADARLIGVQAGSGKTKNLQLKRWPVSHWITLIRQMLQQWPDRQVLLFGGPAEREENEQILQAVAHPRLIHPPTRSIRQAVALLAHCEAFVSVDNAFMHFAAAMKVPKQVVIESPTFGPTIAPYRRPYWLVENPAVHGRNLDYYRYDGRDIRGSRAELQRCMMTVTPEAVLRTLQEALAARISPNP